MNSGTTAYSVYEEVPFLKSSFKIIFKIAVLLTFLYISPFQTGMKQLFAQSKTLVSHLVYRNEPLQQNISLKDRLNVLTYNSNITIPKDEIGGETTSDHPKQVPQEDVTPPDTQQAKEQPKDNEVKENENQSKEEKPVEETPPPVTPNGKKIYIYNTHQEEGYDGGQTVMDGAAVLGKKLEEKGYKVVLETNDFLAYRNANKLTYDQAYKASYDFLNEALVNYGGFDLCIDFHRDSIPREVSFTTIDGVDYAKAMMVVGGLSSNVETASAASSTLTDIVNSKKNGIMKGVMTREAYYNQQVHKDILLMEVGADVNTFEEVCNTLNVVADGIHDLIMSR